VTTSFGLAADLDRSIESFILAPQPDEREFEQLALALFAYQYANNQPYQRLCEQRGLRPANVVRWQEIPAVSAGSFADARLACFPPERTTVRFHSSGTTRRGGAHSVHELESMALYDASLLTQFRNCVLPDRDSIQMFMLSPRSEDAPYSSLAYMLSKVFQHYSHGGDFFIHGDKVDVEALSLALRGKREPALIFGTAFAFVHFLDACATRRESFSLPPGSRVVETGGFKGKSRSVDRDEFYQALRGRFGIPHDFCIAEYGMCELGSQWYDASLADALAGRPSRGQLKVGPHWARTSIVDPVTARPLPDGEQGLLQVLDLSNRGSVAAVLTGDLAIACDGGFQLLGRSPAAPPKGCSITIDGALTSHT
jgi:hypothetical protein